MVSCRPDVVHAILHNAVKCPVPKYCELEVKPAMKRPLYDKRHLVYALCYVVICVVAMLNAPGISQSAGWVVNDVPPTGSGTIPGTLPFQRFLPILQNNGNGTIGTIPPAGNYHRFLPIIANNSSMPAD